MISDYKQWSALFWILTIAPEKIIQLLRIAIRENQLTEV